MPSDAEHRMPLAPFFESLVGVRGCRSGDGVGVLGIFRFLIFFLSWFGTPVEIKLVPRYFIFAHPERTDKDGMLRPFVVFAAWFRRRAAHEEFAAGNGHHIKLDLCAGDSFGVRLMVA